jgi:hypothetical protein
MTDFPEGIHFGSKLVGQRCWRPNEEVSVGQSYDSHTSGVMKSQRCYQAGPIRSPNLGAKFFQHVRFNTTDLVKCSRRESSMWVRLTWQTPLATCPSRVRSSHEEATPNFRNSRSAEAPSRQQTGCSAPFASASAFHPKPSIREPRTHRHSGFRSENRSRCWWSPRRSCAAWREPAHAPQASRRSSNPR